ncbi:unnamed protein product [Calypogeia fissa]
MAKVHLSRYSNHIRRYRVLQQKIAFAIPADDVAPLRERLQEMKKLLRADLGELERLCDACGDYLVVTIIYGQPFDALLTDFEGVLTSDREAEGPAFAVTALRPEKQPSGTTLAAGFHGRRAARVQFY